MSRPSHSRRSSFSFVESASRRSSISSHPNIFSDDYALEPIDSRLDLTLQDTMESDYNSTQHDPIRDTLNITPYPAIPARLSMLNRPSSISKRPIPDESDSPFNDRATQRTMSTSSRFSVFRSQSPYTGPTQPSHPYAMYPQITRASSIASQSTIRPQESPFVSTGGPEHPYSMFQQNTVPVDDDEDIGTQPIPLGFPVLGIPHQGSTGTASSDVGDIIGSDGHVESLPPYTRYADNVVAKGDMANINDTSTLAAARRLSRRSTLLASETASSHTAVGSNERETLLNEDEEKPETWKEKAQKKVCGGITLWLLVFIVTSVVFAGVVGGIIGGIVGRRQGTDSALQAAATTIFMDSDPTMTNKNTPACPTGRYTIPLNQTREINGCVANPYLGKAWSCLDIAFLGITISKTVVSGNQTLQVRFDDYSVDTKSFRYGPQPPDFNGSAFDLAPSTDRDNKNLGVAMFLYKEFDKLAILPDYSIRPPHPKRGIEERYVQQRGNWDGVPLQVGETPWYCWWNATINEFWIFLEEPVAVSSWDVASISTTPPDSSTKTGSESTIPTGTSASTKWSDISMQPTPTVTKRGAYTTPYYPQYPQLVKMIEKRKPSLNVGPYCQHMQVLADWSIVPKEGNEIVPIIESEYASHPIGARWNKRDAITHNLESNCVCEWLST